MKYWGWPLFILLISILLVISVFRTMSLESYQVVNHFVKQNREILWSLGTLLLVAVLSLITTGVANASADGQKRADRSTAAEIEIAKFRQAWIDSLRSLLADVIHLSGEIVNSAKEEYSRDGISALRELDIKIRLMLNPTEDKAIALLNLVRATIDAADMTQLTGKTSLERYEKSEKFYGLREQLATASAAYIKAEWEVVKEVLRNAKREWT